MSAHADIGPSALSRVRLCPGSYRANKGRPSITREAAAEGSVLHYVASESLEHGFEPWDFHGQTIVEAGYSFTLGEEPAQLDTACMVEALDWIREQPGILFVEQRVSLDPYMPGQFGTCDVAIYTPAVLTVLDWKFGFVLVRTVGNEQIQAYAIGMLRRLTELGLRWPKKVRLIIEQPRPAGGARYFEPWEIDVAELMQFADVMTQIWVNANDPNAPRCAGEKQCHFCDEKEQPGGCAEHSEFLLDMAGLKMDEDLDDPEREIALPDPGVLSPARRTYLIRHRSMFVSWLDMLKAQTLADAIAGLPTPDLKAVEGEGGNRFWVNPEAAEAYLAPLLGEKIFNKKLISPPHAEKLLKATRKNKVDPKLWENAQSFIDRPPGVPTLTSVDDPRPAYLSAETRMDEVDD